MKQLVVFLLLSIAGLYFLHAADLSEKARIAEEAYNNANYETALSLYGEIEQQGGSFALYYNIGNTYFKTADYAKAKLYYLRAQRIKPSDKEIAHNLNSVEMRLTDSIKSKELSGLLNIWQTVKYIFGFNFLMLITAAVWLTIAALLVFKRSFKQSRILPACVVIVIMITGIAVVRITEYSRVSYILTAPETEVYSEPLDTSAKIFTIHAGVQFSVKAVKGEWRQIVLKNGYRGWMKTPPAGIYERI